jgi:membrane-bound lytic murein transglycosylase D
MKHLTRSFWELAHRRVLPRETVDYVPKFIAASMIAREPEKYGFTNISFMQPLQYETIETNVAVDLEKLALAAGVPYESLKTLNPSYRTALAVPIDGRVRIRVPVGQKLAVEPHLEKAYSKANVRYLAAGSGGVHRVQKGDNLGQIARLYGTSVHALLQENDLRQGSLLRVGALLKIPEGDSRKPKRKKQKDESTRSINTQTPSRVFKTDRLHRVEPGETLAAIAKRYQVALPALVTHNKLGRSERLLVGNVLKIPASSL